MLSWWLGGMRWLIPYSGSFSSAGALGQSLLPSDSCGVTVFKALCLTGEQTGWPQCGMIELLWYNACIHKLVWLGGHVISWERIHLTGIPWGCWKHFVWFFFYYSPQGVEFVMSHSTQVLKIRTQPVPQACEPTSTYLLTQLRNFTFASSLKISALRNPSLKITRVKPPQITYFLWVIKNWWQSTLK